MMSNIWRPMADHAFRLWLNPQALGTKPKPNSDHMKKWWHFAKPFITIRHMKPNNDTDNVTSDRQYEILPPTHPNDIWNLHYCTKL